MKQLYSLKLLFALLGLLTWQVVSPGNSGTQASAQDVKITYAFAEGIEDPGTISISYMDYNTFDVIQVPNGGTIPSGTMISIYVQPSKKYKVKEWYINGEKAPDYTFDNEEMTKAFQFPTQDTDYKIHLTPKTGDETYKVEFKTGMGNPYDQGTLTATANGQPFESGALVKENSKVVITATPNPGYTIASYDWSYIPNTAGVVSEDGRTLTIESLETSMNISAYFSVDTQGSGHKVTFGLAEGHQDRGYFNASYNESGETHYLTPGQTVKDGTEVLFAATPATGYEVAKFTVDGIDVPQDELFEKGTQFSLKITKNVDVKVYYQEKAVADKFQVNFGLAEGQTEGATLRAEWKNEEATHTIESGAEVPSNTVVSFYATVNDGYEIVKWTINGTDVSDSELADNKTKFVKKIEAATDVRLFVKKSEAKTYTIKFNLSYNSKEKGTISATVNGKAINSGDEVPEGAKVIITAQPHKGCSVSRWTPNYGTGYTISEDKLTYTIDPVKKNWIVFLYLEGTPSEEELPALVFGAADGQSDMGSVKATTGFPAKELKSGSKIKPNTAVNFVAKANDGYKIVKWTKDGQDVESSTSDKTRYTCIVEKKDVKVLVHFAPVQVSAEYNVVFSTAEGQENRGKVKAVQDFLGTQEKELTSPGKVPSGLRIDFNIEAEEGYELEKLMVNNVDKIGSTSLITQNSWRYSINSIEEDVHVVAFFKSKQTKPTYKIEFGTRPGCETLGKLEARVLEKEIQSGAMIDDDAQVVFTATPAEGYELENWYVNGEIDNSGQASENPAHYYYRIKGKGAKVEVSFKVVQTVEKFLISFKSNDPTMGTVEASVNGQAVQSGTLITKGDKVVFTAKIKDDKLYEFKEWLVNKRPSTTAQGLTLEVTIKEPMSIEAVFQKIGSIQGIEEGDLRVFINGNMLTISGLEQETAIAVYSITGKLMTQNITQEGFNISHWADGIYLVRIQGKVFKVIKQ